MSSAGPVFLVIYKTLSFWCDFSFSLYEQRSNLGILIGTYSFTMLGFLAAALAVLLGMTGKPLFKRFRADGSLSIFFTVYTTSIVTLSINFALSIFLLSKDPPSFLLYAIAALTANSTIQTGFITLTIINFCKKALT